MKSRDTRGVVVFGPQFIKVGGVCAEIIVYMIIDYWSMD